MRHFRLRRRCGIRGTRGIWPHVAWYSSTASSQDGPALSAISSRRVYAGVAEVSVYVAAGQRHTGFGGPTAAGACRRIGTAWHMDSTGRDLSGKTWQALPCTAACGFRIVGSREKLGRMNGLWRDVLLLERRSAVAGVQLKTIFHSRRPRKPIAAARAGSYAPRAFAAEGFHPLLVSASDPGCGKPALPRAGGPGAARDRPGTSVLRSSGRESRRRHVICFLMCTGPLPMVAVFARSCVFPPRPGWTIRASRVGRAFDLMRWQARSGGLCGRRPARVRPIDRWLKLERQKDSPNASRGASR